MKSKPNWPRSRRTWEARNTTLEMRNEPALARVNVKSKPNYYDGYFDVNTYVITTLHHIGHLGKRESKANPKPNWVRGGTWIVVSGEWLEGCETNLRFEWPKWLGGRCVVGTSVPSAGSGQALARLWEVVRDARPTAWVAASRLRGAKVWRWPDTTRASTRAQVLAYKPSPNPLSLTLPHENRRQNENFRQSGVENGQKID